MGMPLTGRVAVSSNPAECCCHRRATCCSNTTACPVRSCSASSVRSNRRRFGTEPTRRKAACASAN
eukprot:3149308-Pyramimonas_sp.AAC.1